MKDSLSLADKRGLGKLFNTYACKDCVCRMVGAQEFFVGLNECKVCLTKEECNALMAALDSNSDGDVDYDKFLIAIRGQLNEKRCALVEAAFAKFDP